ncbi:MAG: RsmD family RNA methyltransferase [Candidatus Aenigmatarchaeota archaeon]|nr:methyltransferase [Candidatus Aenigmarchaeota archaeon]
MENIQFYSEETRKFYKLVETETWPTVVISGIRMHRTDKIDPKTDTILKLKAIGKIKGKVLDTCCGLGYTSILASRYAYQVFTFEKDKNMIKIAKLNKHSSDLFSKNNVFLSINDSFAAVKSLKNSFFDFIIHDPPRFSFAPELYSLEFYKELYRILKPQGKLYHYTGSPGSKNGKNLPKGIINRLLLAGFNKAYREYASQGVVALKF